MTSVHSFPVLIETMETKLHLPWPKIRTSTPIQQGTAANLAKETKELSYNLMSKTLERKFGRLTSRREIDENKKMVFRMKTHKNI